jgi:hypothetical protein
MRVLTWTCLVLLAYESVAPPVTEPKKKKEETEGNEVDQQVGHAPFTIPSIIRSIRAL